MEGADASISENGNVCGLQSTPKAQNMVCGAVWDELPRLLE